MTVRTSAGSTLRISQIAPSTFDAAGYSSVFPLAPTASSPQVGEITSMGEFGREYALVTHQAIDRADTQKFKASFNEGSISLELALDEDDAGQELLKTAAYSYDDFYFQVTNGGETFWFPAKVMSFKVNVGSVDQITAASVMLEITSTKSGVGIVQA